MSTDDSLSLETGDNYYITAGYLQKLFATIFANNLVKLVKGVRLI